MKTEDFMDLLTGVDDKYIQELYEESANSRPARKISRANIRWTRIAAIAAAFALIMLGSVLVFKYKTAPAVITPDETQQLNASHDASVVFTDDGSEAVILDVNPSIEIKLDLETNQVTQLIPLNEDAKELLTTQYINTSDLNDCMGILLGDLAEHSYITPTRNSVLVTVLNAEGEHAQKIADLITQDLEACAKQSNMSLSVLTQTLSSTEPYEKLANDYHISVGKAALINSITSTITEEDYDYSKLAAMNIQALNQVAEYLGNTMVRRVGYVAGGLNQEQLDLIGIAEMEFNSALELAQQITETYGKLVNANPSANDPMYYNYWINMEQTSTESGGSEWSLVLRDPSNTTGEALRFSMGGSSTQGNYNGPNLVERTIQGFFDFWSNFFPH